jgi:hypothetical protein
VVDINSCRSWNREAAITVARSRAATEAVQIEPAENPG